MAIKIVWRWQKDKKKDDWNKIESSEVHLNISRQLLFEKNKEANQSRKNSFLNI